VKKIVAILFILAFAACKKDSQQELEPIIHEAALLTIPEGFPEMLFPEGNEFTEERWRLGKLLFFDKRLSINNSINCGSCHKPSMAFADNVPLSSGVFNRPGTRNSPSLANVGYHPYLLKEGSVPTLEMQVLVPIQEHNEFNHNIVEIANELKVDPIYADLSKKAYDREFDPFVITRAISNFQRTMISGNSPYDKFNFQNNSAALNSQEKAGMNLFFSSKTNCSNCHGGFNFTNYHFDNNGLDSAYADNGRQRFTNNPADEALFKVPSLRNVGLTAPYMHNGSLNSLAEVIEHYNSGGKNHKNRNSLIRPLSLTEKEKAELLAFLNSLSDFEFVTDSRWIEEN
jgi:cytochrome c peroxidase